MQTFKIVDKNLKELKTDIFLHPGEVLEEELEARELRKKDFASRIGIQAPHLSDLLKGKRHVSARIALKLEKELGIEADFWLRLQVAYDLAVARKELEIS